MTEFSSKREPRRMAQECPGVGITTTSLQGELLPYGAIDRPGFWAYRLLPDGTLLETELTREEWHALGDRSLAKQNDAIDALNQHPLNVAALEVMRRAGEVPGGAGALRRLHVLSLASLALPCDEGDEDEPPWSLFAQWTGSVGSMATALKVLEDEGVTPGNLLEGDLHDAAGVILSTLDIA